MLANRPTDTLALCLGLPRFLSSNELAQRLEVDNAVIRLAVRRGRLRPDGFTRQAFIFSEDRVPEVRDIVKHRKEPLA